MAHNNGLDLHISHQKNMNMSVGGKFKRCVDEYEPCKMNTAHSDFYTFSRGCFCNAICNKDTMTPGSLTHTHTHMQIKWQSILFCERRRTFPVNSVATSEMRNVIWPAQRYNVNLRAHFTSAHTGA